MAQEQDYLAKKQYVDENYQPRLVAGTGISINPITNEISSSGGGSLVTYAGNPNISQGDSLGVLTINGVPNTIMSPGLIPGTNVTITTDIATGAKTIAATGGTTVTPNPQGAPSGVLTSIGIGNAIYSLQGGAYYGTTDPDSELGIDGDIYIKYISGIPDTIDAMFVKINDEWIEAELGGGGGSDEIVGISESEYEQLPDTKLTDNLLYLTHNFENIFNGADVISMVGIVGVTYEDSSVSMNRGTLSGYEYSAGHEGFCIALQNLTVGESYKLDFDFQFTSAQFFGAGNYCVGYKLSDTLISNYENYTTWEDNLPRDLVKHHHSETFSATATTMYLAFELDGCSDNVNNYFTISNLYVINGTNVETKAHYNGLDYGESGGGTANAEEMTYAEYNALTPAEKIDGTIRFITDYPASGSDIKTDIFRNMDVLSISDRYATASLNANGFSFNMREYDSTWSTNATIYNNTVIDLTDYDALEFDIEITAQADYGAFWLTLSKVKYTWGGSDFPAIYPNVSSLIRITESGTYSVDISELNGNYYIYLGGTTGKPAIAHGGESNDYNGEIVGILTSLYGVIHNGDSEGVIPNPQGEPTDTLNTIGIDGIIYDIAGSGGGSFDVTDLFINEEHLDLTQITLLESIENYDLIEFIVEDRTYQNYTSFVYDSEWIVSNVPYISDNPTGTFPHIFIPGYNNHYMRATMGQTNDKLIIPTDKNSLMIYAVRGIKCGGGGGGDITIEYKDYANFVAQGRIILPFTVNSDYKITATFQVPTYKNDNSIFGNTSSSNLAHCTIYNSRYYVSSGNGETNFEKELYGKHTVTMNDGGYTTFDGDNTTNFTPTTDNSVNLVLAGRNSDSQNYMGKIYEFIIESISTGTEILHVKPAIIKANGIVIAKGLLDSVSGEIYSANGMTLGND